MTARALSQPYPAGMTLIEAGLCPIGAVHPIACWTCMFGHATERHHPMDCEEARCGRHRAEQDPDEGDGEDVYAEVAAYLEEHPQEDPLYDPDAEDIDGMFRLMQFEQDRQARIAAGVEHVCVGCGCSETKSCAGGCVWATPNLRSRCV